MTRVLLFAALALAACSVDPTPPWPAKIEYCYLRCDEAAADSCTTQTAQNCAGPMDADSCAARLGCEWGMDARELDHVEAVVNRDPVTECVGAYDFFACVLP